MTADVILIGRHDGERPACFRPVTEAELAAEQPAFSYLPPSAPALLARVGARRSPSCLFGQLGHFGLWLLAMHSRPS